VAPFCRKRETLLSKIISKSRKLKKKKKKGKQSEKIGKSKISLKYIVMTTLHEYTSHD